MTLKSANPGSRVIVQKIRGQGEVKRRLMDMGIVPGTEIEIQKVAPLGDPVEIKFKGYNLSLRWNEADTILVEELSPNADASRKHAHHRHKHGHKGRSHS
ncbi:MAG: ferrous iron transport protein A [bacterium]|nr:ferrous iron transport protein A [bacterium]